MSRKSLRNFKRVKLRRLLSVCRNLKCRQLFIRLRNSRLIGRCRRWLRLVHLLMRLKVIVLKLRNCMLSVLMSRLILNLRFWLRMVWIVSCLVKV